MKRIAVLVGSLRKESFSRRVAGALISLAPETLKPEIVELGDLSMYNQDLDDTPPAPWTAFRQKISGFDGFLFVTPEYNRSLSAVLKNALDVGSRPYGQSVWNGKPAAVVSVSPGPLGAFGANHILRQSLVFLNVPAMQQPEAYIGGAANLFDSTGALSDASKKESFGKFMSAFDAWVAKNSIG
jgi:chromate reductase